MKRWVFLLLFMAVALIEVRGQDYQRIRAQIEGKDTISVVDLYPVFVFARKIDLRRYEKLIYNLKKVYPIAKEANRLLREMEVKLQAMPSKRQQEIYVKEMEKFLKEKYTPVLRKMTFSQGKILIKLIDRETNRTSYQLVQQLRGRFSAFLWQGVARLFGANLKDRYDKEGEDRMLERLIILYEAGQL